MSSVVGVVQARLGSSRLPGKVLLPLAPDGKVLLQCITERMAAAKNIAIVRLTTSDTTQDDPLVDAAKSWGIETMRGPVDDIIGRLHGAVRPGEDILVRIWGDCPFIDPLIIDQMLAKFKSEHLDFLTVGGIENRSLPMGLDVEIYRTDLLRRMHRDVADAKLREFPYEFVRRQPELKSAVFQGPSPKLAALHLTVDYPEDLYAARHIYAALALRPKPMELATLLDVLAKHPEFAAMFSTQGRNIEYKAFLGELAGSTTYE